MSLLASGKRLDDEYLARRAAGRPVLTRDGSSWLCLAAAAASAAVPCVHLLDFSGWDDSATWLLTLVVAAAVGVSASVVRRRGSRLLGLLGAAALWAVSAAGLLVTYVFVPAAALLTAAVLLRSPPRSTTGCHDDGTSPAHRTGYEPASRAERTGLRRTPGRHSA